MYGCNLSILDGTEKEYQINESIEIPVMFSYKKYLPKAINQGYDPICVPCAISSYADWKLNLNDGSNKSVKMDLWELYESREEKTEGMNVKEALNYAKNSGVQTKEKGKFQINEFSKVGSIISLKNSIITNGPSIGVLPVYGEAVGSEFWNPNNGGLVGYHAISIVGYNDEGFIIRNSWGSSYGIDGYSLLDMSDFNKLKELWSIEG